MARLRGREARRDSGIPELPFDPSLSDACGKRAHDECYHMHGYDGAGEGKVTLCSCTCHRSCPVQGSPDHMEFMLFCTCPAHVQMRRNQERAGITPAEVVRLMEEQRQRWTDPDWVKSHYVGLYEAAAAQLAGRPSPDFSGSPHMAMEFAVISLAKRFSVADAARLLGLTEVEVAAIAGPWREATR